MESAGLLDFGVGDTVNMVLFLLGVGVEKCGRIGGPSPHKLVPLQLYEQDKNIIRNDTGTPTELHSKFWVSILLPHTQGLTMAVHSLLTQGGQMVTLVLLALCMQHFHQ